MLAACVLWKSALPPVFCAPAQCFASLHTFNDELSADTPLLVVQASNVTVGASSLATSTSLQLTASLINSVGSDKLCCLGQAFAAIVDAEIADGSVGVRFQEPTTLLRLLW